MTKTISSYSINKQLIPNYLIKELNEYNQELSTQIFREMGELGFLVVDVPEDYLASKRNKDVNLF